MSEPREASWLVFLKYKIYLKQFLSIFLYNIQAVNQSGTVNHSSTSHAHFLVSNFPHMYVLIFHTCMFVDSM